MPPPRNCSAHSRNNALSLSENIRPGKSLDAVPRCPEPVLNLMATRTRLVELLGPVLGLVLLGLLLGLLLLGCLLDSSTDVFGKLIDVGLSGSL